MSESESCHECGRSLGLVPDDAIEMARESLGFGAANDRIRSFCGVQCKARWSDMTARTLETDQTRITAWDSTGIDLDDPDAITWAV